ncbi:hypothetical protein [Akkermansia sp.]
MRIPPSPPIALVSLSLLAVPVSMADTTDSGTSPSIQNEGKEKKAPQFKLTLREYTHPGGEATCVLRDSSFPYPKDYMLQDYLAALEQFLEEQQARGMPLEKITCFSTPSLGRAKDV